MSHKYGAKPLWYNEKLDQAFSIIAISAKEASQQGWLYFASTLEYEVFRNARAFFSQRNIKCKIETQHTIEILPKQDTIKAITWCVDIKVDYKLDLLDPYPSTLYIEAKGIEMDDYKLKMNLLARCKPEILAKVRVIRKASDTARILANTLERLSR